MKLYLCSYQIQNLPELKSLVGKDDNIKVAYIPNAKDYYADRARRVKLRQNNEYLHSLGFTSEIVDLLDYNASDDLQAKLIQFDMLWVGGGNTFCLRDAMQSSGFDQIIHKVLDNGIVYAGESAGACVTGTSLQGLETADEPEFTENIIWEGLSLIPHFILPHSDNPVFAADTDYARQKQASSSIIEIKDSQALIFENDHQRLIEAA